MPGRHCAHRHAGLALFAALLVGGCATAPPPTPPAPAPSDAALVEEANALLRAGCYRCLLQARSLFQDLMEMPAPSPAVREGLFQATLLVALREREMGLPRLGQFDTAVELAASPEAPPEWALMLEVAQAAAFQVYGLPKSVEDANTQRNIDNFQARDEWNERLREHVPTDPLAAYLYLGLNCRRAWWFEQPPELTEVLETHDDHLYARYRRARCDGGQVELSVLTSLEPRFTEMEFFLGQWAVRQDPALAEFHYGRAWDDWPVWPGPALALGDLAFAAEDFELSLQRYDDTLGLVPDLRDALLGKARALSYLQRPTEAIPLLDRLLELGQWYLGDIYFWRAFNRFALDDLAPARADIEDAKRFRTDANIFTLSGEIAFEEDRLDYARQEFEAALDHDSTACDAAFHLGRVHAVEQRWPDTGTVFDHASGCYVVRARQYEAALAQLRDDPTVSEARKNRLAPRHENRVETARHRAASSAYNASLGYYNDGQLEDAFRQATRSAAHPEFRERAARMIGLIDGRR